MLFVSLLIKVLTDIQLEAKKLSKKVAVTVIYLSGKTSFINAINNMGPTQTKVLITCNKKEKAPNIEAGSIRDSIVGSFDNIILGIVYAFL